ncbi:MAG: CbiX/SirB N-terminal domain-containing protein [Chthoniobacterales bacterium]
MPTSPNKSTAALLIVGHGSTLNPDSSEPTYFHADEIRKRGIFAEVAVCFWKEQPSLREACELVESETIYVVPNFISEGYFTQTVIPRELELTGPVTQRNGRTFYYCEPVGNHPRMTEALLKRAAEVAPGIDPAETSLLIAGHGTDLNENSARAVKTQVQEIAARNLYADVRAVYMEESPLVADWDKLAEKPNVIMVPFFISDGLHSYQDIPVLLGIETDPAAASEADVFRKNPYHLRGKTLYYASAIGTEPLLTEVILDQVAAFDSRFETSELQDSRK